MLVSLRQAPGQRQVYVHPLGDMIIRQQVLPLNIEISRFGNTVPSGERRFSLNLESLAGVGEVNVQPVQDFFAPAQFIDMADDRKLSSPSFELMDAGLRLSTQGMAFGGQKDTRHSTTVNMEYETCILGPQGDCLKEVEPVVVGDGLTQLEFRAMLSLGAGSQPAMQRTGRERYRAPGRSLSPREIAYVVADTENLKVADLDGDGAGGSYTAAWQAMQRHLARHPEQRGRLQVVSLHETLES
jgi:hypothetical protein